jgi:[acyl-carrier-protein] S-malonyltransferase
MKHIDGRWLRWSTATDSESTRSAPGPAGSSHSGDGEAPAQPARSVSPLELASHIESTALAFRGYDVANLGRSLELLEHELFGPVVQKTLDEVGAITAEVIGKPVDLAGHIRAQAKTSLATFPLDIATIVGMELAQLELAERFFEVPMRRVRLTFGYSIGELSALIFGGSFALEHLLPVPLTLAPDCAELAEDTTLGVLFTRGAALRQEDVERLCRAISSEGKGLIGPSAYLSPNTALLLGQGHTLDRVETLMTEFIPARVMLRRNPNRWPPLHSPLVWQRHVPNRTAMMLYGLEDVPRTPEPAVLSLVTGDASYDPVDTRDVLVRWTDHPQRLWDVIDRTLTAGIEFVLHVGPAPNLISATFARLENNVIRQLGSGNRYIHMLGRGLASELNRHAWLTRLLPSKAALLRLPYMAHVILEDWLLEQPVPRPSAVLVPQSLVEPVPAPPAVAPLEGEPAAPQEGVA